MINISPGKVALFRIKRRWKRRRSSFKSSPCLVSHMFQVLVMDHKKRENCPSTKTHHFLQEMSWEKRKKMIWEKNEEDPPPSSSDSLTSSWGEDPWEAIEWFLLWRILWRRNCCSLSCRPMSCLSKVFKCRSNFSGYTSRSQGEDTWGLSCLQTSSWLYLIDMEGASFLSLFSHHASLSYIYFSLWLVLSSWFILFISSLLSSLSLILPNIVQVLIPSGKSLKRSHAEMHSLNRMSLI